MAIKISSVVFIAIIATIQASNVGRVGWSTPAPTTQPPTTTPPPPPPTVTPGWSAPPPPPPPSGSGK